MFIPCIPFGTDAPRHHWPVGTVLLIGANVATFFQGVWPELFGPAAPFFNRGVLVIGALNPFFWLTANLLHGDWARLLCNMLFLWTFGVIVEGKLGFWAFVPLYLLVGAGYAALVEYAAVEWPQYVSPELYRVGILGSTAAIYALAVMAFVWLPANHVRCAAWIWFKGYVYELPIFLLALVFAGVDVGLAWWTHGDWRPAVPPLVGAPLGLVVASLLLWTGWVDGQGWDLFSVLSGREGEVDLDEMRQYRRKPGVDPD